MSADTDHFNGSGMLCAGQRACAYCMKCDSCSYKYPGRPHADICSTPTECSNWICPTCTAWLRDVDRAKQAEPEKPKRKRAVRSEA